MDFLAEPSAATYRLACHVSQINVERAVHVEKIKLKGKKKKNRGKNRKNQKQSH